jgi:CRP-like cAMP-binding protein
MNIALETSRPKILVVEDSYPTALAVCDLVVKHGCDVAGMVGDVDKGIAIARDDALDGALIDIDLRGTASFPICEQLRKRDIPFVFLTGHVGPLRVPEQFRSAPWLPKPVNDHELGAALAGLTRPAPESPRGNLVLERLGDGDWSALQPHLERVPLATGETLVPAKGNASHIFFPVTGLISVFARNGRGKAIEVALVGREGVAGAASMLGRASSPGLESVVHVAGSAWRVPAAEMLRLLEQHPSLRADFMTALHDFVGQMSDNVVSIGSATIEQRLARRLLTAAVRLGSHQLALTHDALARLLAVRRSGITVALHVLESRKVIRSRRNLVEILDHEGLARAAGDADVTHMEPGARPSP